mmetsp:Transcript_15227/g.39041  ORF Transcript_15227/g.39041 Transcript_15227/m.39041 type:complete len:245 (+) Transcript_15227:556-1290(+)
MPSARTRRRRTTRRAPRSCSSSTSHGNSSRGWRRRPPPPRAPTRTRRRPTTAAAPPSPTAWHARRFSRTLRRRPRRREQKASYARCSTPSVQTSPRRCACCGRRATPAAVVTLRPRPRPRCARAVPLSRPCGLACSSRWRRRPRGRASGRSSRHSRRAFPRSRRTPSVQSPRHRLRSATGGSRCGSPPRRGHVTRRVRRSPVRCSTARCRLPRLAHPPVRPAAAAAAAAAAVEFLLWVRRIESR